MSKKIPKISVDFQFGVLDVIPSTQEAYTGGKYVSQVRKSETAALKRFREVVSEILDERVAEVPQFPTDSDLFIFIIQYFMSENQYRSRDIDNMAKTILDILKDRFYRDDSQVQTLLVSKKIDDKVPQKFAYVAIKELKDKRGDIEALRVAGIDRAVTLFYEEIKKEQ